MTYAEILKDPRWQKKRLEVLNYANFRCQLCGDKKSTLHVHHSYYCKGKKPWQYPCGSMIALCEVCHAWVHERMNSKKIAPTAPKVDHQQDTDDGNSWPAIDITTPWGRIVSAVRNDRPIVACWVELAEMIGPENGVVELTFPSDESTAATYLMRPATRTFIEGVLSNEFSQPITLRTSLKGGK